MGINKDGKEVPEKSAVLEDVQIKPERGEEIDAFDESFKEEVEAKKEEETKHGLCEYELIRLENIRQREALFAELNLDAAKVEASSMTGAPSKRVRQLEKKETEVLPTRASTRLAIRDSIREMKKFNYVPKPEEVQRTTEAYEGVKESGQAVMEIGGGNTKENCTAPQKRVTCTKCGISLCENYLKRHMHRFHLEGKPCDERMPFESEKLRIKCEKKGSEETKWDVLSRFKTKDVLPHQNGRMGCEECGKSFSKSNSLAFHKRIFHRGERLQCKVSGCEATFSKYSTRNNHERMLHGRPKLRCKFEGCSSEFFSILGLKYHHSAKH